MNVMTVVRYKLKSGFEDEFINAINAYNYSNSILMHLVSIGNDEYLINVLLRTQCLYNINCSTTKGMQ